MNPKRAKVVIWVLGMIALDPCTKPPPWKMITWPPYTSSTLQLFRWLLILRETNLLGDSNAPVQQDLVANEHRLRALRPRLLAWTYIHEIASWSPSDERINFCNFGIDTYPCFKIGHVHVGSSSGSEIALNVMTQNREKRIWADLNGFEITVKAIKRPSVDNSWARWESQSFVKEDNWQDIS